MEFMIRPLHRDDETILWELQYYASLMDEEGGPKKILYTHPYLARYVQDWGKIGDFGFIGHVPIYGKPVGAVWCRLMEGQEKGYGFVAADIPELSIAVFPQYRRKGIGRALLSEVIKFSNKNELAISLAVRSTNKAVGLYEQLGFVRMPGKDFINRSGILSYVMIYNPADKPSFLNDETNT